MTETIILLKTIFPQQLYGFQSYRYDLLKESVHFFL